MLVDKLRDQWIWSCGNWVDMGLYWCPNCCEDRERDWAKESDAEGYLASTLGM